MLRCKAAFQPVLFLLLLPLLKLLLCFGANTLQIQFLHNRSNTSLANTDPTVRQNDPYFFRAIPLRTIIENLLNL